MRIIFPCGQFLGKVPSFPAKYHRSESAPVLSTELTTDAVSKTKSGTTSGPADIAGLQFELTPMSPQFQIAVHSSSTDRDSSRRLTVKSPLTKSSSGYRLMAETLLEVSRRPLYMGNKFTARYQVVDKALAEFGDLLG